MALTAAKAAFAQKMVAAAKSSGHPWAGYAAAEAVLESGWGTSELAQRDLDVFGLKAPLKWTGAVDHIQTEEVLHGHKVLVPAVWPVFASYADAFATRLAVLFTNPAIYGEALDATTGRDCIRLVSGYWHFATADSGANVFQFPSGLWEFEAPPP